MSSLSSSSPTPKPVKRRSLVPMIVVFLVSLAPIVGAFVMYFNPQWWPDDGRSYGQLVSPQRPVPSVADLKLTTLEGKPFDLSSLKGKWVLLAADDGDCGDDCARKLFITRNVHASLGKNVDRAARVWIITDNQPVPDRVLEAYQGTVMVRADPAAAARFLLGKSAADAATPAATLELNGPIWVIDPLGHLMLQFPAEADPVKVRDDFRKLINNSRIG